MSEEEIPVSSLIDTSQEVSPKIPVTIGGDVNSSYTFLLVAVVICLVLFLIYHAYSCFCVNQEIEPYLNTQPRTDTQSDKAFDVDDEVQKLSQMQEQYLEKLQRARTGNS
jgi:cell division protein FtsL